MSWVLRESFWEEVRVKLVLKDELKVEICSTF